MKEQKSFETPKRCGWCPEDPLYRAYHDLEWGVPVFDEMKLFEMLVLEGAQAGLSWLTVLRKREAYRKAFQGFDFNKVSLYDETDLRQLLNDQGLVRNRLKLYSVIQNARALLEIKRSLGSFSEFLWNFVDGKPIQNQWESPEEIPSATPQSMAMAKELRAAGFRFVGPVICYSFIQAVGMVNDHEKGCFRHKEIRALGQGLKGK